MTLVEVNLNPFQPQFGLYVWVTIAFFVVLYGLGKKVFPKLDETLADRERRIKDNLEDAEDAKARAEQLIDDYRRRIAKAREEANLAAEEIRQSAEAARKDVLAKAEVEAREILNRSLGQLTAERDRLVGQLGQQMSKWVAEVSSAVLEREITPEAHRDLVDQFIRRIEAESQRA